MSAVPTAATMRYDRTTEGGNVDTKTESCGTCRFWQMDGDAKESAVDPSDIGFGFCRRRPPTLIETLVRMTVSTPQLGQQHDMDQLFTATDVFDASSFPGSFHAEWCGDFEWVAGLDPSDRPIA